MKITNTREVTKLKELQERIKKDGIAVNEDILKVDSFINHQVDPVLMQHIGEAFADEKTKEQEAKPKLPWSKTWKGSVF